MPGAVPFDKLRPGLLDALRVLAPGAGRPQAVGIGVHCETVGGLNRWSSPALLELVYSTITQSLLLRPKTSGEYISSALAGGTTKVPGVVARATYVYW
jgi:hypothetical protein